MKRSFLLLLMTCAFAFTFAQHIKFMGIPLGQPVGTFCQSLKQKGFYKEYNYINSVQHFAGDFWKFKNVHVSVMSDNGLVFNVNVSARKAYPLSTYNNLVNSFTQKYGKCTAKKGYTYTWKVKGGEILTFYLNNKNISIDYTDRISPDYIRKYQKRNPNNDL